jgi:hypothetical protein
MTTNDEAPEVRNVDDIVLRDLESKFSNVACPVHNTPPRFETAPDGSVIEYMCCDALREIIRELQAKEASDTTDGVMP